MEELLEVFFARQELLVVAITVPCPDTMNPKEALQLHRETLRMLIHDKQKRKPWWLLRPIKQHNEHNVETYSPIKQERKGQN